MSDLRDDKEQWEQQFGDLPLPEQEASWQDMKQKLEKDERSTRILPPFILNCAAWSLLGIALIAGGWFLFFNPKDNKETARQEQNTTTVPANSSASTPSSSSTKTETAKTTKVDDITGTELRGGGQTTTNPDIEKATESTTEISRSTNSTSTVSSTHSKKDLTNTNKTKSQGSTSRKQPGNTDVVISQDKPNKTDRSKITAPVEVKEKSVDLAEKPLDDRIKQDDNNTNKHLAKTDSLVKTDSAITNKAIETKPDTAIKKEAEQPLPAVADTEKAKQNKKSKFYFSAGLGMHQQIPTGEQKSVSFNYYGKPTTVTDYFPSVHFRLHYTDKFFAETGFRYGAPQAVPQFSYSKLTTLDTAGSKVNTTSTYLRKTYYHQVPLTINYNILPNWSIGAGGIYSIFHGAVAEEEINSFNYQTMGTVVDKRMVNIKEFNDSFFYKTQAHILLQSEYSWKRFSLGLRYSKGIENYIKYTMPDGTIVDAKNHSLEMILRYRLWKSQNR